jgi:hypothetical protein
MWTVGNPIARSRRFASWGEVAFLYVPSPWEYMHENVSFIYIALSCEHAHERQVADEK